MYRSPDATPRCTACGNSQLTPETKFDTSEGLANVYFRHRDAKPDFFGSVESATFAVDRARVCLDCGHVMLSFCEAKLAALREAMPQLVPLPGL